MKSILIIFSFMVACSALADQEFYRGDSTYYIQPGAPKKQIPGMITLPAGTYQRLAVGMQGTWSY